MTQNLTKSQNKIWQLIKPHLKDRNHETEITFDDDLRVTFDNVKGHVSIIIFPNGEVYHKIERESGGFESEFHNPNYLETLIKVIQAD